MPPLSTKVTPQNIERVQAQLRYNLAWITDNTEGLSEAQVQWKPSQDEWSLLELFAHLRSSADMNHFRIFSMLAVENPVLPTIHPRLQWQKIVPYTQLPLEKSLLAYRLQREELLLTLRSLNEDEWQRGGTWDGRSYSIYLVARSMALHEEEHFEQIEHLIEGSE